MGAPSKSKPFVMSVAEANRGLCPSNKRYYKNSEDASLAREAIYKRTGSINRIYVCPHCGKHHLTSDVSEAFIKSFKRKRRK